MSVKKKVKVSKNKKKSWRKHTDIKEIEDFLENKRFEERAGVSNIDELKDEELFMIEKTGDDKAYQEKLETYQNRRANINVEQSQLRKLSSGYNLYRKLESTSSVPAVRSRDPNKERKKTVHNDDAKLEKYWNDKKESIEAAKKLKEEKKAAYSDPKKKFKVYDLWDDDSANKAPAPEDFMVNPPAPIRVPVHLRQKPSLLPSVEVPIGGQSYNPDRAEHKELIMTAATKEMQRINEENKWTKRVEKYFVSKKDAPNERSWLEEMSQGLGLNEQDDGQVGETEITENLDELAQFAKLVKSDKKTKQQRRREMREKLVKQEKDVEKKLKLKEGEVFRLKSIKKELDQRDKKLARRANIRAQLHIESLYKPKRLSRFRFEESEIPLNLPNEVSGSLRAIKVEGNLLEDRFKSLQKRNIIETRVPQKMKRKFKLKKETKRRHKPDTIEPVA